MSEYTDGFTPREVMTGLTFMDDMLTPPVMITFTITGNVGLHPAEAADALLAGRAAIAASLEAAFPGLTADPPAGVVTGSKSLS